VNPSAHLRNKALRDHGLKASMSGKGSPRHPKSRNAVLHEGWFSGLLIVITP